MTSEVPVASPSPSRAWLRSTVLLVLLTRFVQLAAAPVTLWMVATRRPLAEQGLYFVFWNIQGLTQLMELGVGNLVVNHASHESPHITLGMRGAVTGDPSARSRLLVMLRDAQRWYARFAWWFVAIVGVGGALLLWSASSAVDAMSVLVPWAVATVFVAAYMSLVPRLCAIEGGGGLVEVQRMRLAQVLIACAAHWVVLWWWGALWAVATFSVLWFGVAWTWLRARYAALGPAAARSAAGDGELASVQRRTAATWLAIWVAPQVLTPIVLMTHGADAAGRVGMTLAIAMAPSVLAGAWLQARYPRYAALLARGAFAELRELAIRSSLQAALVATAGIAAAAVVVSWLPVAVPSLEGRALAPSAVVLLGLTSLAWLMMQSLTSYFRAWRREPLTEVIVVGAVLVTLLSAAAAARLDIRDTVAAHAMIIPGVLVALLAAWYSQARRRAADVPLP